ncbi:MAG: HesA/MoeB/ThiF family protein [Candidatus Woesearchaeota archaeon]
MTTKIVSQYSYNINLINIPYQKSTMYSEKTVTIVGLGGLGSNTANLLVRAGISNLRIIDHDKVQPTNLHRQLYTQADLGKSKAAQLKKYLLKINKTLKITAYPQQLTDKNLKLLNSDLVLDCTDNLQTRFLINDYCLNKIPWVHATATQNIGRIFAVMPNQPCFRCIYQHKISLPTPVLNTTVALTSAIQANEALKILNSQHPCKDLITLNITKPEISLIEVKKQKGCSCGNLL